jgi:hypothetical protein
MPNWCNNFIEISGEKSNMKPIYDYFNEGQKVIEKYYEDCKKYREENPDATDYGVSWEDNLVMNTLVPHDEEYDAIEKSGEFLLNPQTEFYGTKWDFDLREANVISIEEGFVSLAPSTAWSPPTEFCERLAKKYNVEVTLQYEEGGVGFVGKEFFTNEGMVEQEHYDDYYLGLYNLDKETFWSMVESECENIDEDTTEEEFLKQFDFVSETDLKSIKEDFHQYKSEL